MTRPETVGSTSHGERATAGQEEPWCSRRPARPTRAARGQWRRWPSSVRRGGCLGQGPGVMGGGLAGTHILRYYDNILHVNAIFTFKIFPGIWEYLLSQTQTIS